MLQLRPTPAELLHYASEYDAASDDSVAAIVEEIRGFGYLSLEHLHVLARWKSKRAAGFVLRNSPSFVEEVTRTALATSDEQLRVEVLTLLAGVGWPLASVVLHWSHREPYPILDFRALWSVCAHADQPYTFALWQEYTAFTRTLCDDTGLSMRELDRALWQYSKVHQGHKTGERLE